LRPRDDNFDHHGAAGSIGHFDDQGFADGLDNLHDPLSHR
jgi:hypothetical protein